MEVDQFPRVKDQQLNKELNSALSYVYWLVISEKDLPKDSKSDLAILIKKDICIHLGAIVEGILYYIVSQLAQLGKIKISKPKDACGKIHTINDTEYIAHITTTEKEIHPKNCDFAMIVDLLYGNDIIDEDLADTLHFIRETRNSVHLSKFALQNPEFADMDALKEFMPLVSSSLGKLKNILPQ